MLTSDNSRRQKQLWWLHFDIISYLSGHNMNNVTTLLVYGNTPMVVPLMIILYKSHKLPQPTTMTVENIGVTCYACLRILVSILVYYLYIMYICVGRSGWVVTRAPTNKLCRVSRRKTISRSPPGQVGSGQVPIRWSRGHNVRVCMHEIQFHYDGKSCRCGEFPKNR